MLFPTQVEVSCPKEMAWKVNMYRGYLAICHPEEQQLSFIERLVEMASSLAIREWRRLPHVVSHVHTPLLQVGPSRGEEGAFSRGSLLGGTGCLLRGPSWGDGGALLQGVPPSRAPPVQAEGCERSWTAEETPSPRPPPPFALGLGERTARVRRERTETWLLVFGASRGFGEGRPPSGVTVMVFLLEEYALMPTVPASVCCCCSV